MYKATLKNTNLNYRDSLPDGTKLGTKLGTWTTKLNPTLTVLEVINGWAVVYYGGRLVYASEKYLKKVEDTGSGIKDEVLDAVLEVRQELGPLIDQLWDNYDRLKELVPDSIIIPQKPAFSKRVSDKMGLGFLTPVASNLLSSDEEAHTKRNSPSLAWDLSVHVGTPVYSVGNGKVVHKGIPTKAKPLGDGGFGAYLVIDTVGNNGTTYRFWYAHLNPDRMYVNIGDTVTRDTMLSHVAMTGYTSFEHIHYQVKNADNSRVRIDSIWDRNDFYHKDFAEQSDYE